MFIKWIVCKVPVDLKENFSYAQKKWLRTKSAKGFLLQTGGWNLNDETEACIISFWESEDALRYFMNNLHDQILNENKQDQFYRSITVDHFNSILVLKGQSSTFIQTISYAKLLTITDCRAKEDKLVHFEQMQKDICQPGMKKAKGLLGGYFSKSKNDTNKYLVFTFWNNQENHKKYVNNILTGLRENTDVLNDVETITVKQVRLVESWKIINEN